MADNWNNLTNWLMWGSPDYSNPADAAMPYLQHMGAAVEPFYGPYKRTGRRSMDEYYKNAASWATPQGAMNNYNTIAGGYSTSPTEQYYEDAATDQTMQAAAASGQAGTPSTQVAVANETENIANKYMQDYINTVLGIQNKGQEGLGNLTHLGFQASDAWANDIVKKLMSQASLAYAGQANQNQYNAQQANTWSSLAGMTMGAFGF